MAASLWIAVLTVICGVAWAEEEVKMIIEITRHGTRMPIDWALDEEWTKGLQPGELTNVGKRMHYLLGKEVAQRYQNIFGKRLKHDQFYIRSTNIPRAINSGICHMFGLWDQFSKYKLPFSNNDTRLLPPQTPNDSLHVGFNTPLPEGLLINPFHTEILSEDSLLLMWDSDQCPWGFNQVQLIFNDTARKLQTSNKFKKMVEDAHARYGLPFTEDNLFQKCINLGDFASQDVLNNPFPRIQKNEDLFKFIERCYQAKVLTKYKDLEMLKIHNAELVQEIIKSFSDKVGDRIPSVKYHYYSAHDSTMSGILVAAGVLSPYCVVDSLYSGILNPCPNFPEVASNLIFELINDNGNYFVRVLYNFEALDICQLANKGENFRCSFKAFKSKFTTFGDANRVEFCFKNQPEAAINTVEYLKSRLNVWKISSLIIGILCASITLVWCVIFFRNSEPKSSRQPKFKIQLSSPNPATSSPA